MSDPIEFGIQTLQGLRASNGTIICLTEDEIWESQNLLSRSIGIFSEPAGGVGINGLIKLKDRGEVHEEEVVVIIVTGYGLKDPKVVLSCLNEAVTVPADLKAFSRLVESWEG